MVNADNEPAERNKTTVLPLDEPDTKFKSIETDDADINNFSDRPILIRKSPKSFKLNDANKFGKPLEEKRSRVDVIPILAPTEGDHTVNVICTATKKSPNCEALDSFPDVTQGKISVYVQQNVDAAYVNMEAIQEIKKQDNQNKQGIHSTEDNCLGKINFSGDDYVDNKLRAEYILKLQQLMRDTSAAAQLAKSQQTFNVQTVAVQVPSYTAPISVVQQPSQVAKTEEPELEPESKLEAEHNQVARTDTEIQVLEYDDEFSDFTGIESLHYEDAFVQKDTPKKYTWYSYLKKVVGGNRNTKSVKQKPTKKDSLTIHKNK